MYPLDDEDILYPTNKIIPEDSQSLIRPQGSDNQPAIPLITNRPERRQEAIATGGGYLDEENRPISYKDSPEGRDISLPAISLDSPVVTNQEEYRQAALQTGGAFIEKDGKITNYKAFRKDPKQPPAAPPIERQLEQIGKLTPEQITKVFEGKFKVSLTRSAREQAEEEAQKMMPVWFKNQHGYDITKATNADLLKTIEFRDKQVKVMEKILDERQKLASDARKEFSGEGLKKLQEENAKLENIKKKLDLMKPPTPKNVPFMRADDPKRQVVMVNENDPNAQAFIDKNGLVPWSKPEKPEKPEYSPKDALKRMTAISSAIARLKGGSTIDALLMAQIPEYAGLMASSDPAAKEQAINQMTAELEYVKQYAPKGTVKEAPKEKPEAPVDVERQNAEAAIKAGKNPKAIKALYKQRTGKDY